MPRLSALLLVLLGASTAAAAGPDDERLGAMVVQDCGSCHGLTLKGGLGPALTRDALAEQSPEALAHIILFGIPESAMPGWQGLLTAAEADWIAEALKDGRLQ